MTQPIDLTKILAAMTPHRQPVGSTCDQCKAQKRNHQWWHHPELNRVWLCTPCHHQLLQRQAEHPDLPAFVVLKNTQRKTSDLIFLEYWDLYLAQPHPLTNQQLHTITQLLGITSFTASSPGQPFRHSPAIHQQGHQLIIQQFAGLAV